jgi:hypothetical protein
MIKYESEGRGGKQQCRRAHALIQHPRCSDSISGRRHFYLGYGAKPGMLAGMPTLAAGGSL